MKRFLTALIAVLVLGSAFAPPTRGQVPPGPAGYRTPPFSPYLNLNRRGTNPAINYYGLVRPQVEFRNSIQNLQQQVTDLNVQTAVAGSAVDPNLPPTGHPVQFQNYSHYFGGTGTPG